MAQILFKGVVHFKDGVHHLYSRGKIYKKYYGKLIGPIFKVDYSFRYVSASRFYLGYFTNKHFRLGNQPF